MAKSGKSGSGGPRSRVQNRDAKTGHFLTRQQASKRKPENVVRERVPNPGYGDTGRGSGK